MSRISASPTGLVTEEMKDYYTSFALGGFAMIITEGLYTDNRNSKAYENQPGLVATEHVNAWKPVIEAVHQHDALLIAQLMHAGALSQLNEQTIAPSAIQPIGSKLKQFGGEGMFPLPKEMDPEDIEIAEKGFVSAAICAHNAGFDGVELHAANGYLLDQFITQELNHRSDSYGGSIEARLSLIREIVEAIRERLPKEFVIGLRLSEGKVNDLSYRWKDGHLTAGKVLRGVKKLKIDYIHIAVQTGEWERDSFYDNGTSFASLAREITGKPVIVNGSMHILEKAERALNEGHADFVAIGKAAIADPHWPIKILEGRAVKHFHKDMLWPEATISHSSKIRDRLDKQIHY